MRYLLIFLMGCADVVDTDFATISECGSASDHVSECGATLATCNACSASCFDQANCLEIVGRLNVPLPEEIDGGKIYSTLDLCLKGCQ